MGCGICYFILSSKIPQAERGWEPFIQILFDTISFHIIFDVYLEISQKSEREREIEKDW